MNLFDFIPEAPQKSDWKPPELRPLNGMKNLIIDYETEQIDEVHNRWPRAVGVAVQYEDGVRHYYPYRHAGGNLPEEQVIQWQKDIKGVHITNAETKFDVNVAKNDGVDFEEQGCTVSDVQHHVALLDDHRREFNLDALARDMGVPLQKHTGLDKLRMKDYHAADVADYACNDVGMVAAIKDITLPQIKAQGLERVLHLENDVIYPTCEMERNGSLLDMPKLEAWRKQIASEINKLKMDIAIEAGFQVNVKSVKDVRRLFEKCGLKPTELTEGGQPSASAEALRGFHHPLMDKTAKLVSLLDVRSKFLDPYWNFNDNGIIRYRLHQLKGDDGGTISGRFSSSGVNIQQVLSTAKAIKKFGDTGYIIRELFIPEPGAQWFCADMAQVEYRLFAHYAESQKIFDGYAADPWMSFHKFIWEMLKRFKADMEYRGTKDLNFMRIYGGGLAKLALMMGFITKTQFRQLTLEYAQTYIPRDHPLLAEALKIDELYNRELPEAGKVLRKISDIAKNRGYVKTLLGRRSRFPGGQRLHKAANAVIQGGAADINKVKLVEVHKARKHTGLKLRMTVHDEISGDATRPETFDLVTALLNRQSVRTKVPILWETGVGKNWRDAKHD